MAVKGRGNQRNSRDRSNSDLSSQFESFSRSLDNHTKALNDFIDEFNKTAKNFNKGNSKTNNKVEEGFSDIHRDLDRSTVAQEKSLTTYQKVGKSIEVVVKNVGSAVIRELKSSYDSIKNSYESHLSSITAQLNLTNDQYKKLYDESASYFKESGLNKQWSPVDYAEALEDVLSTGLRGDQAKTVAYQNLMINKLLPAVSVNTASMRRMTKTVGQGFSDNLTAFAKYTEQTIGAEGVSEGKLNSMLDTLETNILYASKGNEDAANSAINALTASTSLLESMGMDSSKFVDMLYSATTGQVGDSSVGQALLGMFDQKDISNILSDPDKLFSVVENYMKLYASSGHNDNLLQAKNSALGLDQDEAKRATTFVDYGGDLDSISSKLTDMLDSFNYNEEKSRLDSRLQKGDFQSANAALTKKEENLVTGVATTTANLARFDEAVSLAADTLKSLVNIWLMSKVSGSGSSDGSLLKNLLGKAGTSLSGGLGDVSAAAELYNEGAKFSEIASVSSKGTAALGKVASFGGASSLGGGLLNLAAGPGALIAGGVMTAADAINAGKVMSEDGGNAADIGLASVRAAFTGRTTRTQDDQTNDINSALKGEKKKFDWGAVGKNAGKGALIGAGIGTATAGWAAGLGTVIGTGVGAISGAVTSMIDQAISNAKYNKLADASTELSESLSTLEKSQESYNKVVSQGQDSIKMMDYIIKNRNSTDEEAAKTSEEYFKTLQDLYPQQIGNLETVNDLDSRYVEILNNKIDRENNLAAAELASNVADTVDKMSEQWDRLNDLESDKIVSESSYALASKFAEVTGGENGKQLTSKETNDIIKDILKEYQGLSEGDAGYEEAFNTLVQEVNSGKSGKILDVDESGKVTGLKGQKGHGATAGDNVSQFLSDYSNYSDNINTIKSVVGSNVSNAQEIWSSAQSMFSALSEDQYSDSNATKPLRDTLSSFNKAIKDITSTLDLYPQAGLGYLRPKSSDFEDFDEIYDALSMSRPSFKVGLGTVPYDDFIANLHRGEMVLTAQQAQDYRDSSNVSAEVVGKIASQTESIVEILGNIFSLLSQTTRSHVTTSTIPSSVVSFQGV